MLSPKRLLLVTEHDQLQIGEYVVDVLTREVVKKSESKSHRITIKSMHALLVLVAHRGRVVSRDALLEWVWAGTIFNDDVVPQAIAELCRAFSDERDKPRYLETVSSGGYRLVASTHWIGAPSMAAPNNAPDPTDIFQVMPRAMF